MTRMKRTTLLVMLLLGALARGAWAQDDLPVPRDGQFYAVGTILKAVCNPSGASYKESTWTNFQWWDEKRGDWNNNTPSVPQNKDKCFARFNTPGKYRMMVVHGRWDHDERHEIVAQFTVGQPTPCEGTSNQIVSVRDANGQTLDDEARKAMGLGGARLTTGQTVVVPKNMPKGIEIEFYDYSIMRIASGSQLRIGSSCDDLVDKSPNFKMTLLLGKIWSKVVKAVGGPDRQNLGFIDVDSPYHGTGVRGTTYSVAYDPATTTTTVEVEEGTVWMRNKLGVPVTLVLTAGQVGIGIGKQPPQLRK